MGDCYFCARAGEQYAEATPLHIKSSGLPRDVADTVSQLQPGWTYPETIFLCRACKGLADHRDFSALIIRTVEHFVARYGPNARMQMFSAGLFPFLLFATLDRRSTVVLPDDAPAPWKTTLTAFKDAHIEILKTAKGTPFPVRMFINGVGVHAELLPEALQIITIYSTKPSAKNASATLDNILRHADNDGTDIVLCAYPIARADGRELSHDDLIAWYRRHGFVDYDAPRALRETIRYEGAWMQRTASHCSAGKMTTAEPIKNGFAVARAWDALLSRWRR